MTINRTLIRQQFLNLREDENNEMKEKEIKKQELMDEIKRQIDERKLMYKEEDETRRIAFYQKLGVNKCNHYIEFLFNCHYDTPTDELKQMYENYLKSV